jgi:hypothetical protein
MLPPLPSTQQSNILRCIEEELQKKHENPDYHMSHFMVQAVAGSGKTTLMTQCMTILPHDASILYLAFNTSVKDDMNQRVQTLPILKNHVVVQTYNGTGYAIVRQRFPTMMVERWKARQQLQKNLCAPIKNYYRFIQEKVEKLLDYLKTDDITCSLKQMISMCERHELTICIDSMEKPMEDCLQMNVSEVDHVTIEQLIQKTFNDCLNDTRCCDFNDQIQMPLFYQLHGMAKKYDFVFLDEAQDVSSLNLEIALMSVHSKGMIIVVGDDRQSIYGFRSADSDAMNKLRKRLDAKVMPLTISYRCPKSIVRLVQEKCKVDMHYRNDAPEGNIYKMEENEAMNVLKLEDMVLCRRNSPLIGLACKLLKKQMPIQLKDDSLRKRLEKHFISHVRMDSSIELILQHLKIKIDSFLNHNDEYCAGDGTRKRKYIQMSHQHEEETKMERIDSKKIETLVDDRSCIQAIYDCLQEEKFFQISCLRKSCPPPPTDESNSNNKKHKLGSSKVKVVTDNINWRITDYFGEMVGGGGNRSDSLRSSGSSDVVSSRSTIGSSSSSNDVVGSRSTISSSSSSREKTNIKDEFEKDKRERMLIIDKERERYRESDRVKEENKIKLQSIVVTVEEVKNKLNEIFKNNNKDGTQVLSLNTIHNAKGRENARVFVWCHELLGVTKSKQSWAKQEENNLMYVTYTRSKHDLYLVSTSKKKNEDHDK